MTYQEVEEYLFTIPRFHKKHTHEDLQRMLQVLHIEEESFRVIHVAGTNGKGSVCAYLQSILRKGNKEVGMFTSPHLVEFRERFLVNGQMVSKEAVRLAFLKIQGVFGRECELSFFDMVFLMGMVLFKEAEVEYLILETGLGGRLDATNCIRKPLLTMITRIGLDHVEQLGDTVALIAREKAGIIKAGVPVIYYDSNIESTQVIEEIAKEKEAPFYPVSTQREQNYTFANKRIDFSYKSSYYNTIMVSVPSIAPYQVENVAMVLQGMEVIGPQVSITKEMIETGIRQTVWPGRMEELEESIYVDGAHNVDGIQAFINTVRVRNLAPAVVIFTAVKDKEYGTMIRLLAESKLFDQMIITQLEEGRGAECKTLADELEKDSAMQVYTIEAAKEALEYGRILRNEGKQVYIVGSLYLVGKMKEYSKKSSIDALE